MCVQYCRTGTGLMCVQYCRTGTGLMCVQYCRTEDWFIRREKYDHLNFAANKKDGFFICEIQN